MISLSNVSKSYLTSRGTTPILKDVNLHIERTDSLGILGRNGAGKSTLIRIIGGAERPDTGAVERKMSVSWPLAFTGGFQGSLSGIDNLRFICRIYGMDVNECIPFVEEFTELGMYLREPVNTYSSGMIARLAFASSLVVDFECFLIDEIVAVGDARFQRKCHEELFIKRADRARIIVSHDAGYIRSHCNRAVILQEGRILDFTSVYEAFEYYNEMMS